MLNDLDFEQWVLHVFNHPIADPPWYQTDQETWDGEPAIAVRYVSQLFESPERLSKDYSREQLEQGLWYLGGEGQPFMQALLDEGVSWLVRERGLQSIRTFYEKFFAVVCADELEHVATSTPVNRVCYMWWDLFPSWGNSKDPSRQAEDMTILKVMQSILNIPSEACRESALHGLGHWQMDYPEIVPQIINTFLETSPKISPSLREYALAARKGCVQ